MKSHEIRLVGAEFHTDGQTEGQVDGQPGMKLTFAFRNFARKLAFYTFCSTKYLLWYRRAVSFCCCSCSIAFAC